MTLLDRPAQFVSLLHFGLALNIANPHIPAGQHMAEVLPPQVLEQMIKLERGVRLFAHGSYPYFFINSAPLCHAWPTFSPRA